jgi:hypothetical protein
MENEVETPVDNQTVNFPTEELDKLDEMINRPRWVVPVLPKGELEVLLDAAIDLCKRGRYSVHSVLLWLAPTITKQKSHHSLST